MSTSPHQSGKHNSRGVNRSIHRIQQEDGTSRRRSRAGSRAFQAQVSYEDAYNYGLGVALLNYLLQPKKKKKEYVVVPKAPTRVQSYSHNIGDLLKEFIPTGGSVVKLPRDFRPSLEKRMERVVKGTYDQQGYSDSNVKRTFAEAYTVFTQQDFRKTIDRDRTLEPLILKFYAAAVKALSQGKTADDLSWKVLVDRHLALFVRMMMTIFKKHGTEKDEKLMARLQVLEQKLLRNDQDLFIDTGQDKEHKTKTIEVEIPHSFEVKDMHMVQIIGRMFGRTTEQLQSDINANRSLWTEEAALKDLKAYQHRLDSNMDGALRRQDFDVNESFEEWKKGERDHLTSMMLDILRVRPDLTKTVTSFEKPLPVRPTSIYSEDQAYSDLAKMISSSETSTGPSGEPSFGLANLSFDDSASIRSVDEVSYTFIPPDPRAFYKMIVQHAMTYDLAYNDEEGFVPLSQPSLDLLNELSTWWRLPQFTRHITFLECAVRKFLDNEIQLEALDECFDFAKTPQPEPKKIPRIHLYKETLSEIDPSRWTLVDFSLYQQILSALHDQLLRDVYDLLMHCYEPKAPTIGVVMSVLLNHVYPDPAFTQKPGDMDAFTNQLGDGLKKQAEKIYHGFLEKEVPLSKEEWNFTHVVSLGGAVTKLCQRIKKKYAKNPELFGVSPFAILVQTIFPSFEEDAKALVESIMVAAKEAGEEVNVLDGFELYKELVEIRQIHVQYLPKQPFAFHIEGVLEEFVWRWIRDAEEQMTGFVEEAIRQDNFKVRTTHPDDIPTDDQRHSVSVIDVFQLFNQTADQIFQLKWGDDVHHAKFMTALSKAFAAGIGRYCEIVEGKFAKEMDRQTAQEVAAAQKTAQEKFMQMAKDAWNSKEKIEPFQFYAESFVKLNNIEHAMQSLDKLERLMNVDACAELLRQKEGPKDRLRKPDKYVFTVKVVEAEDIKACDPNGYSDPYVVLVDEYQKRLAKTRVVSRTLNPRWDESVDVSVTGAVNVIATLWDYDTFGDHDFVGRTSLKLDPVHFSDYLPREFWLDLDTQGRLLIRVSMEGEKDDIQFHFGKAFRHLKRTERDMVRKITDKLSLVINTSLSREALKSLLSRGIAASIGNYWKTRTAAAPPVTQQDIVNALGQLFDYFDENFAIMKKTLTDATMLAVMTRLWKEVLMAIENLLVPPLSDKPSTQKPLTQVELDVVYKWLELLFDFFNAKDEDGEVLGVPAEILKSPKWHELASLNFWYFDSTDSLIRTSERMVAATQQRAQQQSQQQSRASAPAALGPTFNANAAFGSMGTIRRGKSIMMSRNLGTMKRAKEEKRKEAQADPSDDMILRILRMRPDAGRYLQERHRQKDRMAASQAAAAIVRQSIHQGFSTGAYGNTPGGAFGRGSYGNLPRR